MAYKTVTCLDESFLLYDDMDFVPHPKAWKCCDMTLPAAFFLCPVCGREQDFEEEEALLYIFE